MPNSIASFNSPAYLHTLSLNPNPSTLRRWNVRSASRFRLWYCSTSSLVSLAVRSIAAIKASFFLQAANHSAFVPVVMTASILPTSRVNIPCACFLVFGSLSNENTVSVSSIPAAIRANSSQAVLYSRSICRA